MWKASSNLLGLNTLMTCLNYSIALCWTTSAKQVSSRIQDRAPGQRGKKSASLATSCFWWEPSWFDIRKNKNTLARQPPSCLFRQRWNIRVLYIRVLCISWQITLFSIFFVLLRKKMERPIETSDILLGADISKILSIPRLGTTLKWMYCLIVLVAIMVHARDCLYRRK